MTQKSNLWCKGVGLPEVCAEEVYVNWYLPKRNLECSETSTDVKYVVIQLRFYILRNFSIG